MQALHVKGSDGYFLGTSPFCVSFVRQHQVLQLSCLALHVRHKNNQGDHKADHFTRNFGYLRGYVDLYTYVKAAALGCSAPLPRLEIDTVLAALLIYSCASRLKPFSPNPQKQTWPQKDAGTSATALVVTVVGLAKTRAMYKATGIVPTASGAAPYTHRDNSAEDIEFLSYDVQLASFGGKAAAGVHSFPFSVVLPSELPPSMKVRKPLAVLLRFHAAHTVTFVFFFWSSHPRFLSSLEVIVLHVLRAFQRSASLICVRAQPTVFRSRKLVVREAWQSPTDSGRGCSAQVCWECTMCHDSERRTHREICRGLA